MSERVERAFGGRATGSNGATSRLGWKLATALCTIGGLAACSDGAARLGGGEITTASLGISNQDRIIRKVGTNAAVAAPPSFDRPLQPVAPIAAQPVVAVSDLEPQAPKRVARISTQAAAARRDSFGGTTPAAAKTAVANTTVASAPRKPVVEGGVPVIPPAPERTAALSTVSTYPSTTGVAVAKRVSAAKRTVRKPAPAAGGYRVESGDTLYSISRRYGVSVDALATANALSGNAIRVGQTLAIPGRSSAPQPTAEPARVIERKPETKPVVTASVQPSPRAAPATRVKPARAKPKSSAKASGAFAWPVRGKVIAGFGQRTTAGRNDGIDIAVPVGTPVRAVAAGKVLYSGSEIEGFGNLILVRHANSWVSAYANSSSNLVKRGDKVQAGQTIAKSGRTGDASQPQLHFELRRNSQPVDPAKHLK